MDDNYLLYVCPLCHKESSVQALGGFFFKYACGHTVQAKRDFWDIVPEVKLI